MKKSTLLLPLAMIILASCGGNSSGITTASNEPASDTTPTSDTASTSGSTSEEPAVPGTPVPGDTTSIQYVRTVGEALARGGTSATTYSVTGTVTAIIGPSYTIQQGDYAIYVYRNPNAENVNLRPVDLPGDFEVGKKVTVSGFIGNYNGLIQFKDTAATKISQTVDGAGDTITPLVINAWDVTDIKLSSRLVQVPNLVYNTGTFSAGSSANVDFKQGGVDVRMRVDANIDDDVETEIAAKLTGFTTNVTTITYNGVLGCFNGSYDVATKLATLQLAISTADDVTITAGAPTPAGN